MNRRLEKTELAMADRAVSGFGFVEEFYAGCPWCCFSNNLQQNLARTT